MAVKQENSLVGQGEGGIMSADFTGYASQSFSFLNNCNAIPSQRNVRSASRRRDTYSLGNRYCGTGIPAV